LATPGSPEENNWRERNPNGWKIMDTEDFTTGTTEAHRIAIKQDYALLAKVLEVDPHSANAKDDNGWTPLHEATLRSSEAIIELLIESGADINAVTNYGDTALNLAKEYKGETHATFELLKSLGGKLNSEL
jgi:ankyrin repeat protein